MNFTQTMMADRQKELEKIAPFRERGLYMLSSMRKLRVNQNTEILLKANEDSSDQINRFLKRLKKDRENY